MPVRQGGAALLLTMAVATGTLASAQHASWLRSASDQAAFTNGGDVQVDPPAPLEPGAAGAVAAVRGVTHAMAVSVSQTGSSELVGITAQAAKVVLLRADESPLPPSRLFRAITPAGTLPGAVLPVPQSGTRAGTIRLTATLGPAAPRSDRSIVTLTILDHTGSVNQFCCRSTGRGRPPAPARRASRRRAGKLPAAAGRDHGRVHAAAAPRRYVSLSLSGLSLACWTEEASSVDPDDLQPGA